MPPRCTSRDCINCRLPFDFEERQAQQRAMLRPLMEAIVCAWLCDTRGVLLGDVLRRWQAMGQGKK